MSIFLRWGLSAFLTVIGGTWLAISATAGGMHADLGARTATVLNGYAWADVAFDGRDVVVSGTAGDAESVERLVAEVAGVRGVRSVRAEVVIAEQVSPYPFVATVEDGVTTLSGGVPDEAARTAILSQAEGANDELDVLAGIPHRLLWRAAVDHALTYVPLLEEGEVALSDLELTVRGRARTLEDYGALKELTELPLPEGVVLVAHEVAPPLASPFEWRAEFDGRTVILSGFVPDEQTLDALREVAEGHALSTSVVLASGAPDGFAVTARLLLQNLLRLESGSADISDTTASVAGAPPDPATAEHIGAELDALGVAVDLVPPRVGAYRLTLTRDGDRIVLEGYVPDDETRTRLGARPGLDVSGLQLARGAPERFESGIEFGLSLLAQLGEGRYAMDNTVLSVEGRARSAEAFTALETALALGAPQGLILSRSDIRPPLASPFVWSARKAPDNGSLVFTGFVPGTLARETLREAAGGPVEDATTIADGAPAQFVELATAALGVLDRLETGSVTFDGDTWSLSGAVASPRDGQLAEEAFADAGLEALGWQLALDVPPPEEVVVAPYVWRADKAEDGAITLSGYVPSEDLQSFLMARAGDDASDTTEVAAGAPPGFIGDALAGLEALVHLESGAVALESDLWSLTGVPQTAADAERALAALATATAEGADWRKDLAAPLLAPEPVSPEPEVAEMAAEPEAPEPDPAVDPAPEPEIAEPELAEPELAEPEIVDVPVAEPEVAVQPEPEAQPVDDAQRPLVFAARMGLLSSITLEGAVPTDAARRYLGAVAGSVPTDTVTLSDDLPADFAVHAELGLRLLRTLHAGTFGFDGERWVLDGEVETTHEQDAALAALAAMPAAAAWQTKISLMTPLAVCWEKVTAFADRNVILFASGSATIEDESLPALDELADYLARCPDAAVNVEGHTDSDGDAASNLALSVARAEAVVAALIERGVPYQRLYAVGYGQTLPIADNTTAEGKRANRRIVFSFFEEDEF